MPKYRPEESSKSRYVGIMRENNKIGKTILLFSYIFFFIFDIFVIKKGKYKKIIKIRKVEIFFRNVLVYPSSRKNLKTISKEELKIVVKK